MSRPEPWSGNSTLCENVCFACEKEVTLSVVKSTRTTEVRSEKIAHDDHYYECPLCNDHSWGPELPEPLQLAFAEYRKLHKLFTPKEIHDFRVRLGLTQNELGSLLGVSYVIL